MTSPRVNSYGDTICVPSVESENRIHEETIRGACQTSRLIYYKWYIKYNNNIKYLHADGRSILLLSKWTSIERTRLPRFTANRTLCVLIYFQIMLFDLRVAKTIITPWKRFYWYLYENIRVHLDTRKDQSGSRPFVVYNTYLRIYKRVNSRVPATARVNPFIYFRRFFLIIFVWPDTSSNR